jgi:hypothetical protein
MLLRFVRRCSHLLVHLGNPVIAISSSTLSSSNFSKELPVKCPMRRGPSSPPTLEETYALPHCRSVIRLLVSSPRTRSNPLAEEVRSLPIPSGSSWQSIWKCLHSFDRSSSPFCFAGFGDRLRREEAMKTAGRENPIHGVSLRRNRAHGAVSQDKSRSIKWAEKQEKFQPKEMCFFLTSPL